MHINACSELERVALACSGDDALLQQTSAWVLADMQRLTVPAISLKHAVPRPCNINTTQARQPLPMPPSAVTADISIRNKAQVPLRSLCLVASFSSVSSTFALSDTKAACRCHSPPAPSFPLHSSHQVCAVSPAEVRQQWLAMSPWAHAAVASTATVPDPLAGLTSLSPPAAFAAASLHPNAGVGSGSSGAQLLLTMARDESLPIGIRELCSQQAAAHVLRHIVHCTAPVSPEHAWSLLQSLLPSPCDTAVITSMRTLHFATALRTCASAARPCSTSCHPQLFVELLCNFDVQRVMQAACAGCEGDGRVAQVCCRHVVATALQFMAVDCIQMQKRVCFFMRSAAAHHIQLLLVLLQQLPLLPKESCYSALLTAVTCGVLSSSSISASAATAASAAVSPYCYEEFTEHVLAAVRPYLQRWQAQQLRRTCEANAVRCGRNSRAGSVLWLQPAWAMRVTAGCWGQGSDVGNSSSSFASNCLSCGALSISVAPLPLDDVPHVSHSTQHYMAHHLEASAGTRVEFTLVNNWEGVDVMVAGLRMCGGSSLGPDSMQWLSCALDACLLSRGERGKCSVMLPAACRVLQLQACCFMCGSGSACCSPWLLLNDAAIFLMQPLHCTSGCLLQVLRSVCDRCIHRARASVAVTSSGALEQVLQRFPSRAHEAAEGGGCTWVGAATALGHVVCRVAACVVLRVSSDADGGKRMLRVQGLTADVAGDDADAVCKVWRPVSVRWLYIFAREFVVGRLTRVQVHQWFVSMQPPAT